jgi:hypothetical protein
MSLKRTIIICCGLTILAFVLLLLAIGLYPYERAGTELSANMHQITVEKTKIPSVVLLIVAILLFVITIPIGIIFLRCRSCGMWLPRGFFFYRYCPSCGEKYDYDIVVRPPPYSINHIDADPPEKIYGRHS